MNTGQPVISVDAKKKELVGAFKNGGREYQSIEQPEGTVLLRRALAGFRDLKAEALAVDTEARLAEALLADGDAAGALTLCEDLLGARSRVPGVAQVAATLREVRRQAMVVLAADRRETSGALLTSAPAAVGRDVT